MAFSRVEVMVLLTFCLASAGLFWRRFGSVVSKIREAKPDADFHLAPLGRRVRDFIWEVLLQAKVIRERPWPGLAHAFVFWGFCAFALVTMNHLATGFGFPLLSRYGSVRADLLYCRGRLRGLRSGFHHRSLCQALFHQAEVAG